MWCEYRKNHTFWLAAVLKIFHLKWKKKNRWKWWENFSVLVLTNQESKRATATYISILRYPSSASPMKVRFVFLDLLTVLCVVICRSFGHCFVWPSIYDYWLPLWYLQNFLAISASKLLLMSNQAIDPQTVCKCPLYNYFQSL